MVVKILKIFLPLIIGFGLGYCSREINLSPIYYLGYIDGYNEGILSCPCWEREGNICSLCGIKLENTNQFKRIK